MDKLEKAKEIIKRYHRKAMCGIFDSHNIAGDIMETIYQGDGLTIDICRFYEYFEVFGLTESEFDELNEYYESLRDEYWKSYHRKILRGEQI